MVDQRRLDREKVNAQSRFGVRSLKFIPLVVILLIMACGAITIEIDTAVANEADITHDIRMEASGQIAAMLAEEPIGDDLPESCTYVASLEKFEMKCSGLSHSELTENELGDEGLSLEVSKTDMGDYWEYRATMANLFFDSEQELADNPLAEGMNLDAILTIRFNWTVTVPGEIVDTNADTTGKGVATFNSKLGDEREEFVVVSREDKSTGLFGGCN